MRGFSTMEMSINSRSIRWVAFVFVAVVFSLSYSTHQVAYAQQMGSIVGPQLEMKPKYPLPGDEVKVELKANSTDLNVSTITWKINGEVVAQGYGKKTVTFTAGGAGEVLALEASAVPPKGAAVRASQVVRVSDVSFTWEGRTYTPPFFSGKALVSRKAEVVVVAFPVVYDRAGNMYDPSELVYEWKLNGANIEDASGRGKNSVVVQTRQLYAAYGITLTVKDPAGEVRLVKYVEPSVTEPKIVLYENSPTLGILYASPLHKQTSLQGEEMEVVAEPYHMSASSRKDPALSYEWVIDAGEKLTSSGSLVLRLDGVGAGTSQLYLTIINTAFIAQRAQERLQVSFGQSTRTLRETPTTEAL